MQDPKDQLYANLREAMFANKLTAADLSAAKGVHYTYIYNTIRKQANVTITTATELAKAAGYRLVLSFEPLPGSAELVGNMDPSGPLYTERRAKPAAAKAEPEVVSEAEVADVTQNIVEQAVAGAHADPLDAEIEALLADA